jgi:hypothetical protein
MHNQLALEYRPPADRFTWRGRLISKILRCAAGLGLILVVLIVVAVAAFRLDALLKALATL